MFIVYTFNFKEHRYEKHSAWDTEDEAKKQEMVLANCGYSQTYNKEDKTVKTENGYYYK